MTCYNMHALQENMEYIVNYKSTQISNEKSTTPAFMLVSQNKILHWLITLVMK